MKTGPEILLATRNLHKIDEIKEILREQPLRLRTLLEFDVTEEAAEDGDSYEENATKKALFYARKVGIPSLADDSGLEIEYLQGQPGVHSARFIDPHATFPERSRKILEWMKEATQEARHARFVCVVAYTTPDEYVKTFRGELHGYIAHEMRGNFGFGYDPIFHVPEYGKNLAEIEPQVKNRISHRAQALQASLEFLSTLV